MNERAALDLYGRAASAFEFAAVALEEGNSIMALGLAETGLSYVQDALGKVESDKGRRILEESRDFWTLEIARLQAALELPA